MTNIKSSNEEECAMDETSAADWAVRYTQVVAQQVRRCRNRHGMSAQQLSERCAELGMPMARATIAGFENGRREGVAAAEVFCIALALGVAPIDLLTASEGLTEIAPGLLLDRVSAVGWIAGTPDRAALNEAAADLAAAQDDAEKAHRRVEAASRRLGDLLGPDRSAPPQANPCTDDLRPALGESAHQAIDAALEHLNGLDSETMTETEQALAAAIRQLAVAVMHKAAETP